MHYHMISQSDTPGEAAVLAAFTAARRATTPAHPAGVAIVRREVNSPGTLKYSLSNAPDQTSTAKLTKMQAQRFWIERAFQDAKSHVGMAQYQARQWQSWHRHMALVMMATQFMLEARLSHADMHPLLSCYDLQILLATTLPDRRFDSQEEVMRQMQIRHEKRKASTESAVRNSRN